jgi:hypothetical protein
MLGSFKTVALHTYAKQFFALLANSHELFDLDTVERQAALSAVLDDLQ